VLNLLITIKCVFTSPALLMTALRQLYQMAIGIAQSGSRVGIAAPQPPQNGS